MVSNVPQPFSTKVALRGHFPAELLKQARFLLNAYRSSRSFTIKAGLDQCPATVATVLKRLQYISLDNNGVDVLLLGDDDGLGLALAATNIARSITVVDLDLDLIARIKKLNRSINVLQHDLRCPLPRALNRRFDVVFTDPPYTRSGQLLFLTRGVDALRASRDSSLYLCASRLYLAEDDLSIITTTACAAGLELQKWLRNFNVYRTLPDIRKDLRRCRDAKRLSFFYSDLLHMKPSKSKLTSHQMLPIEGRSIYDYGHNVTG